MGVFEPSTFLNAKKIEDIMTSSKTPREQSKPKSQLIEKNKVPFFLEPSGLCLSLDNVGETCNEILHGGKTSLPFGLKHMKRTEPLQRSIKWKMTL